MKKSLFLAFFGVVLCSCDQYLVPDDFPKEEFYSYAPYHLSDTVSFIAEDGATCIFVVSEVTEYYHRGERNCKCGKESVEKYVALSDSESKELKYEFMLSCTDRALFNICLWANASQAYQALYTVDYPDEDIWAKSFDNTKIFKDFLDEITLSQNGKPAALIKKNTGIVCFVDSQGNKWIAQ